MGDIKKLQTILEDATRRAQVVDDCVTLVDDEVAAKGGLTGLAVKGAYAVVKKVKPGFIREAVDHLLDAFVAKLEPFYADFQQRAAGAALATYLQGRASEVATALLSITDDKAARSTNRTLKSAYDKLRPTGAKHVEAAVPGIGRVLSKHV